MHVKNIVLPIALTNIASSDLTSSYQAINTGGFTHPLIIARLISTSSTGVTISYDGTNDHDYLPGGGVINLELQTNALSTERIAVFAEGTVIYVKGTAGTGNIYVAGYYQPKM